MLNSAQIGGRGVWGNLHFLVLSMNSLNQTESATFCSIFNFVVFAILKLGILFFANLQIHHYVLNEYMLFFIFLTADWTPFKVAVSIRINYMLKYITLNLSFHHKD
jgi:hypothetical protein